MCFTILHSDFYSKVTYQKETTKSNGFFSVVVWSTDRNDRTKLEMLYHYIRLAFMSCSNQKRKRLREKITSL